VVLGVALGAVEGVVLGVTLGMTEGMALDDALGVVEGVALGVPDGVALGSAEGAEVALFFTFSALGVLGGLVFSTFGTLGGMVLSIFGTLGAVVPLRSRLLVSLEKTVSPSAKYKKATSVARMTVSIILNCDD